ncbi:type II CRISPR RNA-guided endonuclease Cas9 [Marinifilum sp. D714]|uniref:type II CRISPR RNA-guided endonuclease Cas9 n=1 Tax=Marinifilum sp. D714 TaxID=2937523 RepID=UPI0027C1E5AB|nr:type II CRISPR RNA-guided endonuclease Cas9 [Marinifilum sp. D714]MDQ2177871.1 type II CRISPR RNA-guided endonuclease Cas9 [Marinifilum sp. D714]
MKKILGLDLGTTSIGWALVNEAENDYEHSEIIKLGVRVNPLTTDEQTDFEKGNPLSVNADRTLKRGARRNLQRYKQRRQNLKELLIKSGIILKDTVLTEEGNFTTHETWRLRSAAATDKIELEEFARVLFAINKKRGYKSSRKAKNEEEGSVIDGMAIAKELYDKGLTPGQYVLNLLNDGRNYIPEFYRSDLKSEFDAIWNYQKQYHPDILTEEFYRKLEGQGQQNTRKLFLAVHQIYTAENKGKREQVKLQHYQWRVDALQQQLPIEVIAYVLVEINNNLNKSSGYLGAISDRSKELYFEKETIGQNLYRQLQKNFHGSLKNKVFYRQDYLDEFEKIWETQAQHHRELTPELKEEVRDVVIFYQRKLKSQKHLISNCEFEPKHKAIPKSSPLFQEFKVWCLVNSLELQNQKSKEQRKLDEMERQILFEELNVRGDLSHDQVLKCLELPKKEWKLNYKEGLSGNTTNQQLYGVYQLIAEYEGYGFDWAKKSAREINEELKAIFPEIGLSEDLLRFDADIKGNEFDKQAAYQLWHLIYSVEDDEKISEEDQFVYGNSAVALKKKLHKGFGFQPQYAAMLANLNLQQDYGQLSARAIKKIYPYLKKGFLYSEACNEAGYNHSHSLNAEELASRELKDQLNLLPKNSLRNPVVEKILNQMVNLVNQVIEVYGKPDEVRIELARELKKSADERKRMTQGINDAKKRNEEIVKILRKAPFNVLNPTRNDIIRYRLYEELSENGYKTIFTNRYISPSQLFSKDIDIEHIIPKAKLFDDSFSNKTLAFREVNLEKGDSTAMDFISEKYSVELLDFKARVESLYAAWLKTHNTKQVKGISKAKYEKLLMKEVDLPNDFIERDLRNSQYIAKKAKQMLMEVIRTVNTTSGSVTDRLRDDWGLVNVMKELNLPKYKALGLTEEQERKNDQKVLVIKDWTKRNDHRHHAMDALTAAFTTYDHVQYLNNLHASREKESKLYGIRNKITTALETKSGRKKRVFKSPMPNFRQEVKNHLEQILISFKAKNKVVTQNVNHYRKSGETFKKVQLTPRGQLHKETVYGRIIEQGVKEEKLGVKMTFETALKVCKPKYKDAILRRLAEFGNDAKKAFTGKNAVAKNPVYTDAAKQEQVPEKVKIHVAEENYTIRKEIGPDLKLDKVIDEGVKRILSARLEEFGGNAKEAFSNLDKNPIWLNEKAGIAMKRVKISGVKNAEALHDQKDHNRNLIMDAEGKTKPVDFVSTGNNHHVAIYRDHKGKLQEQVVSFYEAVARVNAGVSVIDYDYKKKEGWQFLFTMKQNEMFVFPAEGFDPNDLDLLDERNAKVVSKHLYRVQKIATKNYMFRFHLETNVEENKALKDISYINIRSTAPLGTIKKVRLDHLGRIVSVGEELYQKQELEMSM